MVGDLVEAVAGKGKHEYKRLRPGAAEGVLDVGRDVDRTAGPHWQRPVLDVHLASATDDELAGLVAPEWDQKAKHRDGYWFSHGKRVKSELIQEIGGKHVRVSVEGTDKFGRLLGSVTCKGRDIGEWLVREGHAIAAYNDRYVHIEREAREAKRGMWAHAHNFDPRAHRHRERRKG